MRINCSNWKVLFFSILATFASSSFGEVIYYHNDILGSPVAVTNEIGEVVWRAHYYPYGDKVTTNGPNTGILSPDNSRYFTAHEYDVDIGLTYMQARYYDPVVGRFLSTDPVGFVEQDPASFNRYSYANNNPYKYVDPDGQWAFLGYLWVAVKALLTANDAVETVETISDADATTGEKLIAGGLFIGGIVSPVGPVKNIDNAAGAVKKSILGKNPKIKDDRTNTDLKPVTDRATAKSIFRNETRGQKIDQYGGRSEGTINRRSEDGTQIRMNPDGSTRVDLPNRGTQPNGETIHFDP